MLKCSGVHNQHQATADNGEIRAVLNTAVLPPAEQNKLPAAEKECSSALLHMKVQARELLMQ